jgi:hypothetical protein
MSWLRNSLDLEKNHPLDNVLSLLDKKHYVGGLFCDLQKAFDCVNHNVLLEKINFYGISGSAIK